MGDGATIVRPGLISGPSDPTDRFTYWPVRVTLQDRCGGKMLVAGTEQKPAEIQIIDVRDLAAFIVTLAENKTAGQFNAIAPTEDLKNTVDAAKKHSGAATKFVYVPLKFLEENQVQFWAQLPAIVGEDPEYVGFSSVSGDRSTAAGLKTRPIAETVAATLDWWKTLPEDRRARVENPPERSPLMKEARESELLAKWAQQATSEKPA
jgi:2'-hydroxyisoflavone reductase